jgi:two-component system, NtrC family, nitrogen regulation sensor histidine kinase NtrY|tara:strand:+ start:1675 stop:3456 length:1782 start_codon:yes stop_codon:yes gene_type:complete
MFKFIQNFNWIIVSSFIAILLGIITFLTFINRSFIPLNDENLQILLIVDIFILIVFFTLIFKNLYRLYSSRKRNKAGYQTNIKYISIFSLFTFIPSLMIAIFSLFIFNFGIQNFLNTQITSAVNNSYDVAKNYLEESKKSVETDVFLMSVGINRVSDFYYSNKNRFQSVVKSEKILRRIDDVYLIDSSSNIMFFDTLDSEINFVSPSDDEFNQAIEGIPVLLNSISANKTRAMIKISSLIDTYLYIARDIDPEILTYLNETEQAVDFYYSIQNNQTGIKITFAIIYVIVVTLLLFLSTSIAISFATKLTKPIINLISASENISKGQLDSKVIIEEGDEEFKNLNTNFNNMIDRLKKQQDKLLSAERYSAWESVARKLAHEIKNPLTPIQLSIDRLQEKYSSKINDNKEEFIRYLETINRQIKDIENLVNEFSSFARMPSPIIKSMDLGKVIKRSVDFYSMSGDIQINFNPLNNNFLIKGDEEQLYRVFINLIKNSDESISEKKLKNKEFKGKIDIEIDNNNDYIEVKLSDNGIGIRDTKQVMTPYFTTKTKGTGLGLPIVNKIINEHKGEFLLSNQKNGGVEILISLPVNNEK